MEAIGFNLLESYLHAHRDGAKKYLAAYFGDFEPRTKQISAPSGYTGRYFDELSQQSDPYRFDAYNFAAVATLSVPLSGGQVATLMKLEREFTVLLKEVPEPGVALWEVDDAVIASGSPLDILYEKLRSIQGIGYVRASKLLASKRPHLVPVRDRLVAQLLGAGNLWWAPWKELVSSESLRKLVTEISPNEVAEDVSLLRRLDVILWMEANCRAAY